MIGTTIGRYRILAKLGEGGMGTVWKAQHTLLPDRIVALKLPSAHLWDSNEARQRFLREAIAASKLNHRGIATLYDAEEIGDLFYIAFQFIEGATVARQTDAGPLPLAEALTVAADAAAALAHAHAHGVLHRDVSAGNIMIDRKGLGVLVDFGLARSGADTQLTRTGTTLGTLAYMAPEVLKGEPADARSDLYGLGAVLYRMVTGRPLFEADSTETLQFKVLNEQPRAPSELRPGAPPALDDLILRLLEKNPADRPASAEKLARELSAIAELPAIQAEQTVVVGPGERLRGWWRDVLRVLRRRSARPVLGVAALALGLLAVAGIAWLRGWRPAFMTSIPIVAVLPARNTSADAEGTAYLAEGLGAEIADRLNQVSGLRLVPWITSERFGDPSRPLKEVAREMRADLLLVSGYKSDGDRIRVTATLVEGHTGLQRWSQSYEEGAEDLFNIQRSIALGVATSLKGPVSDEEQRRLATPPSKSTEAYEFFLLGADQLRLGVPNSLRQAEPYLARALEIDPGLEKAWVALGAVHAARYFLGLEGGDRNLELAEQSYRKALELKPGYFSATRGLLRLHFYRSDPKECLEIARQLETIQPRDAEGLLLLAEAYLFGDMLDKAMGLLERVIAMDPANEAALWHRVRVAGGAGHHRKAFETGAGYLRRFGEDAEVYLVMAGSSFLTGSRDTTARLLERAVAMGLEGGDVRAHGFAALFYLATANEKRARELLHQQVEHDQQALLAFPESFRVRTDLAWAYALLGRRAELSREIEILVPIIARPGFREQAAIDVAVALLFAGEDRQATRVFDYLRRGSIAGYVGGLQIYETYRLEKVTSHPEFQRFLAEARAQSAALRARYEGRR